MNKTHIDEFFKHLSIAYTKWQKEKEARGSNIQFFDLSNQLNGTIFSYSGWEGTSSVRQTNEKDKVVTSMLERSLDAPSIIVDVGTYDGTRLKKILDSLNPRAYKNIISINGIDINREALSKAEKRFNEYERPFEAHYGRIEKINTSNFGKERKITLYLGNILFNIKDESTIIPFLSKKSHKNDISIIEAHKNVNKSLYPENLEEFFVEYFNQSGIQNILGGKLATVFAEDGKHMFIEDLPKSVKYKNNNYRFENSLSNHFGYKEIIRPVICIGISRALQNNWNFMWSMINQGFEAPTKEDMQLVNDDIVLRLHQVHDKKFFSNLMEKNDEKLNAYGGERLDYILRFNEYPKHYDTHPLIGRHSDQVEIVEGNYGR